MKKKDKKEKLKNNHLPIKEIPQPRRISFARNIKFL